MASVSPAMMVLTLRRLFAFLLMIAFAASARADQPDIAASARGVVRVVLVATDGTSSYFVGHGSGFAVTPTQVLTNAHVVELARTEKNIVIGVVPAEGSGTHGGRIVAFSPKNDLALIQLDEGTVPVSTFFTGAVADGQHVTAIGYPAAVDRAEGLDLSQVVSPTSPVKTSGNVSQGRTSKQFDTILHTAAMAAGNSGGPLVDDCGRVLGMNSFASLSDGNDAEFGFAVSNREIASFLRQAKIDPHRTSAECKSMAVYMSAEQQRLASASAASDARRHADEAVRAAQMERARDLAEQQIESGRENAMAIAALLLAISVLGIGGAGLFYTQKRNRRATLFGGFGGLFLLLAILAFLLRPSYADIEDKMKPPKGDALVAGKPYPAVGQHLCRIDEPLSRITVSATQDVPLRWAAGGCVNGRTQYTESKGEFSRALLPQGEAAVVVNSFDPAVGTFRTDRYFLDGETLAQARTLNAPLADACTADTAKLSAISRAQSDIKALLPAWPSERMIYHCTPSPDTGPAN